MDKSVRTRKLEGLKKSALALIWKSNDFCFDFICMKAMRVARHVMVHCEGHLMFHFATFRIINKWMFFSQKAVFPVFSFIFAV